MIAIERKRNTVLADNRKVVSVEHSYKNPTSVTVGGSSLTEKEEKTAIVAGSVAGLGMMGGAIYAAYKGKYFLGVLTFIASGPVAVMTTVGLAYWFYKNDSTGV